MDCENGALTEGFKMKNLKEIGKNQDGATAIEYGLIATLIAVAIMTSLSSVENSISNNMAYSDSTLISATSKHM
jgi:pilus assembly protein Flp/PilA